MYCADIAPHCRVADVGRRLAGIVALAALIGPGSALAAEPPSLNGKAFVLSTEAGARKPNVAVDDAGTGHFFWNVDRPYPQTDASVYCRVPRGKTACDRTQRFDLPLEVFGEPQV